MNELEQFLGLLRAARLGLENAVSTEEFEPQFVTLLEFIKRHPLIQRDMSSAFCALLKGDPGTPHELIEFCMHELKWPEVLAQATAGYERSTDPRDKHVFADIIDSFGPAWKSLDLYAYYRMRSSDSRK